MHNASKVYICFEIKWSFLGCCLQRNWKSLQCIRGNELTWSLVRVLSSTKKTEIDSLNPDVRVIEHVRLPKEENVEVKKSAKDIIQETDPGGNYIKIVGGENSFLLVLL